MERIMSARELSMRLVERFRRDGVFSGSIWLDKGELILPMRPEFRRLFENALQLRQSCDKAATSSHHDFADAVASMYEDAVLYGSPIDSTADRIAGMIPKSQSMRATYVPVDFAALANQLNRSDDDWHELSDVAISAERKADRARQRALKRSRRNTKNPKKKGKCR